MYVCDCVRYKNMLKHFMRLRSSSKSVTAQFATWNPENWHEKQIEIPSKTLVNPSHAQCLVAGVTTSHKFLQNFTGFQFASASPSRQQFWCGNVYTTKRRVTLPICAFRSLQSREGINCALQRLAPFSCPEFGLPLARGASRCSASQPGTVYLLHYEPQNCRWAPSSACWRLSFSSMREPSSGAVVTEQRVRRRIQISGLNSTQLNHTRHKNVTNIMSLFARLPTVSMLIGIYHIGKFCFWVPFCKKLLLRNRAVDFVEICSVCARKAIIKACKRIVILIRCAVVIMI